MQDKIWRKCLIQKINLKLWVKVKEDWLNNDKIVKNLNQNKKF